MQCEYSIYDVSEEHDVDDCHQQPVGLVGPHEGHILTELVEEAPDLSGHYGHLEPEYGTLPL